MTYSKVSPGQASSGPHLWHHRTGLAQTIVQNATGVADTQKHASRQPSRSQRRFTRSFWQQPALIWPKVHVIFAPSMNGLGSLFTNSTPSGRVVDNVTSQTSLCAHTSISMQYWSPRRHISGWRAITCTPSQVMWLEVVRSEPRQGPQDSTSGQMASQHELGVSEAVS